MSHRLLHHGVRPVALSVLADGRSRRYRRGGYTATPVQLFAVLTATAEKFGLHATASRAVCFGPPSPELLRSCESAAKVTAAYCSASEPKKMARDVLGIGRRVYALCGYEHEWHCAPQGHLTGRCPVELLCTPTMMEQVHAGWALVWHASIGTASSCDTVLVTEQGTELVTTTDLWPVKEIRVQGKDIVRPFLLVRDSGPVTQPALAAT